MNPVGVRALRRRFDGEGLDPDVPAAIEPEMELGAVLDLEAVNGQVTAHEESYGLHPAFVDPLWVYKLHLMVQLETIFPVEILTYHRTIARTGHCRSIHSLLGGCYEVIISLANR